MTKQTNQMRSILSSILLYINHKQPTIPWFAQTKGPCSKPQLWWPIHIINPVDETKLSCSKLRRPSLPVSRILIALSNGRNCWWAWWIFIRQREWFTWFCLPVDHSPDFYWSEISSFFYISLQIFSVLRLRGLKVRQSQRMNYSLISCWIIITTFCLVAFMTWEILHRQGKWKLIWMPRL